MSISEIKNFIAKKLLDINISTKLKLGFLLITVLTLILGCISIFYIADLSQLNGRMYKHPFAVSNAVRDINSNILAMHRSMKDVALSQNKIELENAIFKVNNSEKKVIQNFDLVFERFLGEKNEVMKKYQLFLNWKEIRDEVITLVRNNKKIEAALITKNKGAIYVENLTTEMNFLIIFANNKADEFYKNSKKEASDAIYIMISLLIIIIFLILLIAKKITSNITLAIDTLSHGLNDFFSFLSSKSKKPTPIIYKENDEFGTMIDIVNNNISVSVNLHTELNHLLSAVDKHIILSKTTPEGIITYVSEAFINISGYRKEELIGQPHNIVRHPDTSTEKFRELWQTIQSKQIWKSEVKNLKKDGDFYWADAIITPELDEEGHITGYSAIKQDITYKKEAEEQKKEIEKQNKIIMIQAKVAAVGEMIGNIAHQWRQPLSAITAGMAHIQLATELDKKMSNEEVLQIVKKVNSQCQYLSSTIEDFRDFFEADSTNISKFDLKEELEKTRDLVKDSFENNFIKIVFDTRTCIIVNNKNTFVQSLINLFNNTKDAIISNNISVEDRYLFITMKKNEKEVILSFKDSGGGIKEDVIDKIFEPYFTTKHQSKGTGLGLYMTHKIITHHLRGSIIVENSEYEYNGKKLKGANFIITLPIV